MTDQRIDSFNFLMVLVMGLVLPNSKQVTSLFRCISTSSLAIIAPSVGGASIMQRLNFHIASRICKKYLGYSGSEVMIGIMMLNYILPISIDKPESRDIFYSSTERSKE